MPKPSTIDSTAPVIAWSTASTLPRHRNGVAPACRREPLARVANRHQRVCAPRVRSCLAPLSHGRAMDSRSHRRSTRSKTHHGFSGEERPMGSPAYTSGSSRRHRPVCGSRDELFAGEPVEADTKRDASNARWFVVVVARPPQGGRRIRCLTSAELPLGAPLPNGTGDPTTPLGRGWVPACRRSRTRPHAIIGSGYRPCDSWVGSSHLAWRWLVEMFDEGWNETASRRLRSDRGGWLRGRAKRRARSIASRAIGRSGRPRGVVHCLFDPIAAPGSRHHPRPGRRRGGDRAMAANRKRCASAVVPASGATLDRDAWCQRRPRRQDPRPHR